MFPRKDFYLSGWNPFSFLIYLLMLWDNIWSHVLLCEPRKKSTESAINLHISKVKKISPVFCTFQPNINANSPLEYLTWKRKNIPFSIVNRYKKNEHVDKSIFTIRTLFSIFTHMENTLLSGCNLYSLYSILFLKAKKLFSNFFWK